MARRGMETVVMLGVMSRITTTESTSVGIILVAISQWIGLDEKSGWLLVDFWGIFDMVVFK
jgi:hypothetical protein